METALLWRRITLQGPKGYLKTCNAMLKEHLFANMIGVSHQRHMEQGLSFYITDTFFKSFQKKLCVRMLVPDTFTAPTMSHNSTKYPNQSILTIQLHE